MPVHARLTAAPRVSRLQRNWAALHAAHSPGDALSGRAERGAAEGARGLQGGHGQGGPLQVRGMHGGVLATLGAPLACLLLRYGTALEPLEVRDRTKLAYFTLIAFKVRVSCRFALGTNACDG